MGGSSAITTRPGGATVQWPVYGVAGSLPGLPEKVPTRDIVESIGTQGA